ncbi:MAG: hypothetical protein GY820_06060 [Gammaproteobacteria bacterium]|nr:hypothetical protein [Gammaproteobacteria bacterium]
MALMKKNVFKFEEESEQEEKEGKREFFTLCNLGNTCYLNSVVQVLRATQPLVSAVHSLSERIQQFAELQLPLLNCVGAATG